MSGNKKESYKNPFLSFIQVNLKKSFVAAVEMNKRVNEMSQYIALVTEPYRYNNKFCLPPPGSKVIMAGDEKPRTAIISKGCWNIVALENYCNKDCTVALASNRGEKILLASIYLDINEPVAQTWLQQLVLSLIHI